jgi:RNA polymerase sigma-70 factor (ECF subfamily)
MIWLTEDIRLSPQSQAQFEDAYHLYNRRVYAKCLYMIGNEADAEDLTQDVFLQVFRKIDSFRGESAFATWLYRVAVNVVLVRLRRKTLNTTSVEEAVEMKEGIASLQEVLGGPDQMLTTAIDRLNLEDAFSQMPAGYRQVFLLHDVEGYRHREIARILGLSVGTSKSQLYKARIWLRELLGEGEARPLRSRGGGAPLRHLSQGAGRTPTRHSNFAAQAPCPEGKIRPT